MHADRHRAASVRVLDRVLQNVHEHLRRPAAIVPERNLCKWRQRDRDLPLLGLVEHRAHRINQRRTQRQRLRIENDRPLLQLHHLKERVQDPVQLFCLLLHFLQELSPRVRVQIFILQHLPVHHKTCQWRFQLVRHIGNELLHSLPLLLSVRHTRIHLLLHPSHFRSQRRHRALLQLRLGDRLAIEDLLKHTIQHMRRRTIAPPKQRTAAAGKEQKQPQQNAHTLPSSLFQT